jgi:hypothetical protein
MYRGRRVYLQNIWEFEALVTRLVRQTRRHSLEGLRDRPFSYLKSCQGPYEICKTSAPSISWKPIMTQVSVGHVPQLSWQTTSNQQWVLIADHTKVLFASFLPWLHNCPTKMCLLVMTRHILMRLDTILCLILHAEGMHNKTQNLCLGIIHLFLKNMDQVKGRQERKKRKQTIIGDH